MSKLYVCHHCKCRWEAFRDGDGRPWGWYSLSVNVPVHLGKAGKPYLWAGQWCSAGCLAADMPQLEEQERLARLAYQADIPCDAARNAERSGGK